MSVNVDIGPYKWRHEETIFNDGAFLVGGLVSTAALSVALSTLTVLVFRHKHHWGMIKSGLLGTAIGGATPIPAWVLGTGVATGVRALITGKGSSDTLNVGPFQWDEPGMVNDYSFFCGAVVTGVTFAAAMTTLAALVFRHKHHWSALKSGLMGITIGTIGIPLTTGVLGLGTAIGARYAIEAFFHRQS